MSRVKGPKWSELTASALEAGTVVGRAYHSHNPRSVMGRSTIDIVCPFCAATVRAYIWSLPNGKRCDCGAMFGFRGQAYHFAGVIK